jgi:catechol 2,3-dioxygenase-like lactoylglutathione lyase family enzyme
MSKLKTKLNINTVGRVCVTVGDTDEAIDFYVETLGFEKVVDVPMGPGMRWVEVALPGTKTTIALAPPPEGREAGGSETGICLDTSNVEADHDALKAAGIDVDDEVTRFGGSVPPMFWLRDPDGNSLIVVQPGQPSIWPRNELPTREESGLKTGRAARDRTAPLVPHVHWSVPIGIASISAFATGGVSEISPEILPQ